MTTNPQDRAARIEALDYAIDAMLFAPATDTGRRTAATLQSLRDSLGQGEPVAERLFQHIAHGDEDHRAWLRKELHAFFGSAPPAAPSAPEGSERLAAEFPHEIVRAQSAQGSMPDGVTIPRHVLRWWRELAGINPRDLIPRIDAMLAPAPPPPASSQDDARDAAMAPDEPSQPELKYCWSTDGELYHGAFATVEEAAAKLEGRSGFVAEAVPVELDGLVDADSLIDTMICRANDEAGEASEDWLSWVKREDIAELHDAIMPAVSAWVEKHDPISFWGVSNPRAIDAALSAPADNGEGK